MKKVTKQKDMLLEKINKIGESVDRLAIITARGFERVDKRIDEVEQRLSNRIDGVESILSSRMDTLEIRIDNLDIKMDKIERKINNVTVYYATHDELEDMDKRLVKVEKKVGLAR